MISICGSPEIFIDNKYTRWYLDLCATRQRMSRDCYVEKHHIWPTTLGGPDTPENRVKFTGEEHFVAHWLLMKMTEGEDKRKMCFAVSFFGTKNKNMKRRLTPKAYEIARKAVSEAMKGVGPSPECRLAVSKAKTGVPRTASEKLLMGDKLKVRHAFFHLSRDDVYEAHTDFYRYCDEHKIGRAAVQAKIRKDGVAVITAGKHKGRCFTFTDVGKDALAKARDEALLTSYEKRSKSTSVVHASNRKISDEVQSNTLVYAYDLKAEVTSFLLDNRVEFKDHGDYFELNPTLRLYLVDNAWEFRTPYFGIQGGVGKKFFQEVSIKNEAEGIRTIWIKPWEFDPSYRQRPILESIILAAAGKIKHVFHGRDTEVREVKLTELRPFLEKNCFYGFRGSAVVLGLYLKKDVGEFQKGTLLMIYTFGFPFFGSKKYDLEVIRASTMLNVQVRGGATKLFTFFLRNYPTVTMGEKEVTWNNIVYYVDYDHNNGNSLLHLGFKFEGYGAPGFLNVDAVIGKASHRQPSKHHEIMEKIKTGAVFSVFNAGVKIFTYTTPRD